MQVKAIKKTIYKITRTRDILKYLKGEIKILIVQNYWRNTKKIQIKPPM